MAICETMTQISNPLLNTNLFIPRSQPDLIPRVRLTELLQACAWHSPDAGVAARATFGKTTLVCDWVRESGWKAAWVSNEIKTPRLVTPQRRGWRGLPLQYTVNRHLPNIFLKTGVPNIGYPIDYPTSRIG